MPKRVLIVDDNVLVRHLVRIHLESQPGFATCEEAADGVEAIEKAEQSRPELIILDLLMPRMNGLVAAANLRNMLGDVPIILFTSDAYAVPEHWLRFIGIRSVISKTSPIEVLLKEIYRLVGGARFASA